MKTFATAVKYVCLLLAVTFAFSSRSLAQSARGELAGTIADASGAVVEGAQISALNEQNGGKTETVSTSSGSYRFPELAIGSYTITVTAPGFQTTTNTGLQVTINSVTSLNVALKTGSVTETINVDASGSRVETESSDISGTVSNRQIEDLPLSLAQGVNGMRSPETFVFLVPGTVGPGTGGNNSGNGVFLSRLSGGQAYGAEVLLDGASIQRSENGSSFDETSPSIEALQEFKVTTSTPSAEFGRTTAGIESFSVKSGSNDFHGLAFGIVKNRVFDANNWFNNGYKATKCVGLSETACGFSTPQDQKYDYGGTFSGPVWIPKVYKGKDRTFFLFAWEKYQLHYGTVAQSTVPTAAERGGDFSAILGASTGITNPCTGDPILQNQIFDPATTKQLPNGVFCRFPFAGNIIPTTRFSAAAEKLLAGLPLPNETPTPTAPYGFVNNYVFASAQPIRNTTYTIRIDQNLSDKSKLFGTYDTRQNFALEQANDFPQPFNNNSYNQEFTTHYGRAGWDYTLSPSLLNHVNLGYNRTNSINVSTTLGSNITASSAGVGNDFSKFFPRINFVGPDNFSSLGQQQNGQNIDNGIRINDSLNWQKGRHSFKFGADIRLQQYSVIDYNTDYLTFYRDQTVDSSQCCNQWQLSGSTFASFLLGQVGNGGQTVYNDSPRWNSHYVAGFVEDDVKVTSNLTLNLGLRYDVDSPRHEALNRTSNFSLTAPDAAAGGRPGALVFGVNCHCNTAWADTWYKDIAPRIGFAYQLPNTNGKAVLRGGGAIIYGPLQYSDFGGAMTAGYTQTRSVYAVNGPGTAGAFSPAFQLDAGFPSNVSFAPSLDPDQFDLGAPNFGAVAQSLILPNEGRPSMTDDWSLQLQDELAQDLIFSIGYIGQAAQTLRSGFLSNINNISNADFAYGDRLNDPSGYIPVGGSNDGVKAPYANFQGNLGQALRPFPQYDYIAGDCCLENKGHSTYHAMVVSLNRRFRNGLNLQASYTWSKELTDSDSILRFSYEGAEPQGQSSNNLHLEKAVSAQNTPQQLSLSYLYELPIGKGRKYLNHNSALDFVLGGWQVGAIQRYQSGQPVPFGCATGIPYYQNCISYSVGPAAASGDFASDAYKKNKNGPSFFNGQSWFKPAYRPAGYYGQSDTGVPLNQAGFVDQNHEGPGWFRAPSPDCPDGCSYAPYSLGNIPHVTEAITGPAYKAEDVSLLKSFRITEKVAFQLKGEAFDILNRHRMAFPDLNPADANNNLGFGIPGAVDYGPRQMQVTGRFNF